MPRVNSVPEAEPKRRMRIEYVALLLIMVLFAWKYVDKAQQIHRLAAQEAVMQQQNAALAAENRRIHASIGYYHTDQYVEDSAREYLGFTIPGDKSIQVQLSHPSLMAAPRVRVYVTPAPVWQQWVHSFFS